MADTGISACKCGNVPKVTEFFVNGSKKRKNYFVQCDKCGIRTRNRRLRENAIEEWNRFYSELHEKELFGISDFYGPMSYMDFGR